MSLQSTMLKAAGLQTYYQSLMELSPGALLKANNTVIDRNGVIEPRRGITTYYPAQEAGAGERTVKAKQLFEYRGNIFFHGNGVGPTEDYIYNLQSGVYTAHTELYAPDSRYRIRSEEAKSNFYFTSSSGIKVISSRTAADFAAGFDIKNAGGPKAIVASAALNYTGAGFFGPVALSVPAKVAYRILWIYTDNNDNTNFGAVSPRTTVSNPSTADNLSVDLTIPIPPTILADGSNHTQYKYRIYRSEVTNGEPSDELYQVYENILTAAQVSAEQVTYTDSISDEARLGGVPLYTNQNSGEGILKSNEAPPCAQDLALFQGHMFYANTRTKHGIFLTLSDISQITSSSDIVITDSTFNGTSIYAFQGTAESTRLTVTSAVLANYLGKYINLASGSDERKYSFWFDTTGIDTMPSLPAGRIPVKIDISAAVGTAAIAAAINTEILTIPQDFTTSYTGGSSIVEVTNASNGTSTDVAYSSGAEITVLKLVDGTGEVLSGTRKILISGRVDAGEAIEETMKSLVRVINSDPDCIVTASYISNTGETPGKVYIEKKDLIDRQFYIGSSDSNTAAEGTFFPKLGLSLSNTAFTENATSSVTTASAHGLSIGDTVVVYAATSDYLSATVDASINGEVVVTAVPAVDEIEFVSPISGAWYTGITAPSSGLGSNGDNYLDTITGFVYRKSAGNWDQATPLTNGYILLEPLQSSAESIGNRIYYSKYQEHEAVPILNYIDVGSREQEILRIIKLRESLFVLKEDGIFRLAGQPGANPSWDVGAFDTTCIIKAPDTAISLANMCFFFSNQGYVSVTESGFNVVSKPIQDKLLPFLSTNSSLPSVSFATGYESDRSLLLWTVAKKTDTVATKCYRYNVNTEAWTEWEIAKTCAVLNRSEDKLYFGSSDDNYIEVERKNFDRFDYADRQYDITLASGGLNDNLIKSSGFVKMSVNDVIYQTQYLTINQFNTLLKKLDSDPGFTSPTFYEDYAMNPGDSLTSKMTELVAALNVADPLSSYSFSGTTDFQTIQEEFNETIAKLNISSVASFTNYGESTGSVSYEAVILSLDNVRKEATLDIAPSFVIGTMILYKGITSVIRYAPHHAGDPSTEKQFSYGTFMFNRRSFRASRVGYNSDLSDTFETVDINPKSSSIFGRAEFGTGCTWGGQGDQAELITYVPLKKQRARFLGCEFTHRTALDSYALYGVSITFRVYTTPNRVGR